MKCSQPLCFLFKLSVRTAYIDLHNFFTIINSSGIFHFCIHMNLRAFHLHLFKPYCKISIRHSIAKRISWCHMKCIKIAVSYIDTFSIIFLIQITIQITVLICKRKIPVMFCPGICKFP